MVTEHRLLQMSVRRGCVPGGQAHACRSLVKKYGAMDFRGACTSDDPWVWNQDEQDNDEACLLEEAMMVWNQDEEDDDESPMVAVGQDEDTSHTESQEPERHGLD